MISLHGTSDVFYLNNLKVMQADLRYWDQMPDMIAYVKSGGLWIQENLEQYSKQKKLARISPLITISEFEDNAHFLHDGHHRCVATWLAGRKFLYPQEFQMNSWLYDDYLEIAPHNNWYTPFNPKTHVRTADFAKFKIEAKERFSKDPIEAVDWLYQHLEDFRTIRKINYVADLAAFFIKQKEESKT